MSTANPIRVIAIVCLAQTLAQIGAYAVPALLPKFIDEWSLSNTEAGWIAGIFYLGYVCVVPVLVSLTDRIDPKRIYLLGVNLITAAGLGYAYFADGFWSALFFRGLWGIGWAGTYMPGLKALSDFVEGPHQSRAVTAHVASVGLSGSASFVIAGTIAETYGWRWGVGFAGIGAALAFVLMALFLPARKPQAIDKTGRALLDFRPVLKNRSALAYSIGYCVHTLEMSALRSWVVTFLAFVAVYQGTASTGIAGWLTPTVVGTVMGLLGVWASVSGNEVSMRFGRRRLILAVMALGVALASVIGFSAGVSYTLATGLVLAYAVVIWADSSSLTAGATGSALPGQRGATLAVHTTLGYAGGFLGPLILGMTLDFVGGASPYGWGMGFAAIAVVVLIGPLAMWMLKPKGLEGDRPA
ncbi:MAG: MFS transporter [Rhodospirillaceae bacterium]|nr:MFS transporter [Rhodospirillaceae bacterium]